MNLIVLQRQFKMHRVNEETRFPKKRMLSSHLIRMMYCTGAYVLAGRRTRRKRRKRRRTGGGEGWTLRELLSDKAFEVLGEGSCAISASLSQSIEQI